MSESVALGAVTTWLSGGTPSRSQSAFWDGDIPWISAATLKTSRISDSDQCLTAAGVRAGSKMAPAGATLVLVRGMALHRETRIGLATRPLSFNQDIKALIPGPGLVPDFLLYSMQARSWVIRNLVSSAGSGTGVLNTALLQRLPIWVPDELTQRRIADTLTDADHLIAALERMIVKKQAIKQGMMQQLLTGRTRLPGFTDPWREASMSEVANVDPEALVSSTDARALIDYISLEDVERGEILGHTRVRFGLAPSRARRLVKDGDVLFGTVRPNLQSHAIYRGGLKRPVASTGFAVVRACEHSDARFLFYLLMSRLTTVQVDRIIAGSNYPAVPSGDVRRLMFTVPSLEEQRAIGAVLADCDAEVSILKRRLTKARDIKQGMMQELLRSRRTRLPVEDVAA